MLQRRRNVVALPVAAEDLVPERGRLVRIEPQPRRCLHALRELRVRFMSRRSLVLRVLGVRYLLRLPTSRAYLMVIFTVLLAS